jgi:hypothetical protein
VSAFSFFGRVAPRALGHFFGSTIVNNGTKGISVTENLHFAAYLNASGKLTFGGCIRAGFGDKVLFRFRDPNNDIDHLYEQYLAGATVPAIDLSTSLKMLRRAMGEALTPPNTSIEGKPNVSRRFRV